MLICSNLTSLRVDISFPTIEVTESQRILISGASGSGKSTLLNLMAGLDTNYSGQVQLLDLDWNALTAAQRQQLRADHIGIIFQSLNLIPYLDLIDNVELPARFSVIRRKRGRPIGRRTVGSSWAACADASPKTRSIKPRAAPTGCRRPGFVWRTKADTGRRAHFGTGLTQCTALHRFAD